MGKRGGADPDPIDRGFREECYAALGPGKGGMRLHPSVNVRDHQVPRRRADLQERADGEAGRRRQGRVRGRPKGQPDDGIMRVRPSLTTEPHRDPGDKTDVPAGQIGVGGPEIGDVLGQRRRRSDRSWAGVFTGKAPADDGSRVRAAATGCGDTAWRGPCCG